MAIRVRIKISTLKRAIALLNMSQNAFARSTGISPSYLAELLKGPKLPSPATRKRMLEVLSGYTFDDIFYIEDGESDQRH